MTVQWLYVGPGGAKILSRVHHTSASRDDRTLCGVRIPHIETCLRIDYAAPERGRICRHCRRLAKHHEREIRKMVQRKKARKVPDSEHVKAARRRCKWWT